MLNHIRYWIRRNMGNLPRQRQVDSKLNPLNKRRVSNQGILTISFQDDSDLFSTLFMGEYSNYTPRPTRAESQIPCSDELEGSKHLQSGDPGFSHNNHQSHYDSSSHDSSPSYDSSHTSSCDPGYSYDSSSSGWD